MKHDHLVDVKAQRLKAALTALIFLGVLCGLVVLSTRSSNGRKMRIYSPDAVTLVHQTRFFGISNSTSWVQRSKIFAHWQMGKLGGQTYPPLSPNITMGGVANLYRSLDSLNGGLLVPGELLDFTPRFPMNSALTNGPIRVGDFLPALEELMDHNRIAAIKEGDVLRLVKLDWVVTNTQPAQGF